MLEGRTEQPSRVSDSAAVKSLIASALFAMFASLVARDAAADPPTTSVTWRILEVRGDSSDTFVSRFEVIARTGERAPERVGPITMRCSMSYLDGLLTCAYGGAFDHVRIRRAGGRCVIEAARSTEHGMTGRRSLGSFRCAAHIEERVEQPSRDGGAP